MQKDITISHYHDDDNMSLLICDNSQLLFVLNRFGIPLGFSNKTVRQVCEENKVDTGTFLAVVNILLSGDKSEHINYSDINVESLICYLRKAHSYYLEYRLPSIRIKLERALNKEGKEMTSLILKYFDEYIDEVKEHLKYEEEVAFPYATDLVNRKCTSDYRISSFRKKHDHLDLKLVEMKNILIKYFQIPSSNELIRVLNAIFNCSDDLIAHYMIENLLFIPLIKHIESTIAHKR